MEPPGSRGLGEGAIKKDALAAALTRALAIVAALALLLPLLVSAPLLDPDEGLHAAIAQEMIDRHDPVTPTMLGEPFLDKPVLFFWTEAASLRMFGSTEAAVRLPPLCFGLLGTLTTAWLAAAFLGRTAGIAAGFVYATLVLPLAISETAVHDVALVPFMNVAVIAFWRVSRGGRVLPWAAAAGVCLGLSILTKGLVGVAFTGIAAAAFLAIRPRTTGRMVLAGVIALALAGAVAAPWYFAMERAHPGYLHYYFVDRHLRGFLTQTQQHAGRPWWYYVPILIGGALPWMAYGPFARARSDGERAAWIWLAGGLVLLSVAESKLVTYALPLFPAAAILLAAAWLRTIDRASPRASAVAAWTHGLVLAALPLAAMTVVRLRYDVAFGTWAWWIAIGGAVAIVISGIRPGLRRRPIAVVTAWSAVFLAVALGAVRPGIAPHLSGRGLAQFFNARGQLPPQLLVVEERIGSLVFYLDPALRTGLTPERVRFVRVTEVREQLGRLPPESVIAVRSTRVPVFERFFPVRPAPFARTPDGEMRLYRARTLLAAMVPRARARARQRGIADCRLAIDDCSVDCRVPIRVTIVDYSDDCRLQCRLAITVPIADYSGNWRFAIESSCDHGRFGGRIDNSRTSSSLSIEHYNRQLTMPIGTRQSARHSAIANRQSAIRAL